MSSLEGISVFDYLMSTKWERITPACRFYSANSKAKYGQIIGAPDKVDSVHLSFDMEIECKLCESGGICIAIKCERNSDRG